MDLTSQRQNLCSLHVSHTGPALETVCVCALCLCQAAECYAENAFETHAMLLCNTL